jgi:dolichyl-phosphate-mannose-protein mannosyltransferase
MKKRNFILFLAGLFCFSLGIRLFHLSYPSTYVFDEVYHAYTARQIASVDKNVYDPWAKPSIEKVAYEWSHPPLGKLIMAVFVKIFGDNSFGWRLGSAIFGALCILMIALLSYQIIPSEKIALGAAFLLSMENMFLAQSRIAMLDIYVVFFLMLSTYFYIGYKKDTRQKSLLLCALFWGFAIATKWNSVFFLLCLGINEFLTHKNKFSPKSWWPLTQIVLLGLCIYVVSYTHMMSLGWTFTDVLKLQREMFLYHAHLTQTHDYQSTPIQWVFDIRPVWFFVDYSRDAEGVVANIYNIGNPIILVLGFLFILKDLLSGILFKEDSNRFLHIAYLSFLLPLLYSPRLMFFYHYMPSIIFLVLILAQKLFSNIKTPFFSFKNKGVLAVCTLAIVCFACLLPLTMGFFIDKSVVEYYPWTKH